MWITWICVSKINFPPQDQYPNHVDLQATLTYDVVYTNPSPDKSPCMLAPTPFFTTKSFLSLLVFATNISVVPRGGGNLRTPCNISMC